jgi:hypothetical protein
LHSRNSLEPHVLRELDAWLIGVFVKCGASSSGTVACPRQL